MTLSTSHERPWAAWREPIIISDALNKRCTIQYDKSLTVNCPIQFMTYWYKVQMSCKQTKPVVLRCGIWFRHGSPFLHKAGGHVNSSSVARALCGIGIVAYVATFLVNIFHLPLSRSYFGQFRESLTNTHLTSRAFAITWTWRHSYKRGWMTWMEMIPDRRFSIWFPNKVHCSSRNALILRSSLLI